MEMEKGRQTADRKRNGKAINRTKKGEIERQR
jgi:hypothetical protein